MFTRFPLEEPALAETVLTPATRRANSRGAHRVAIAAARSLFLPILLLAPCAGRAADDHAWNIGNSGGAWSVAGNWAGGDGVPGDDPADTATLAAPGVVRYVTNDVVTAIATLTMGSSANNRLWLEADMTVDALSVGNSRVYPNGNTFTLGSGTMPFVGGGTDPGGSIIKDGASLSSGKSAVDGFSGTVIVNNGRLFFVNVFTSYANSDWTANSGGTLAFKEGVEAPASFTISGVGYLNQGALYFFNGWNRDLDCDITVASNATIRVDDNEVALLGDLKGPGLALTKIGTGKLLFNQISYTYSNKLVVGAGTMEVSGIMPNVTNITVQNGATLIGLAQNFPGVVDGSTTNVIVEAGGTWLQNHNASWIGKDRNNGPGNWSDTNSWNLAFVPTNQATLPSSSVVRYVTNDVVTTVNHLVMGNSANNRLWLEADMTVNNTVDMALGSNPHLYPNGNTFTFGGTIGSYIPRLSGAGTVIKTGSGQASVAQVSPGSFTGTLIARGGTYYFVNQNFGSAYWVAEDGGTLNFKEGVTYPLLVTLSGEGEGGNGALDFESGSKATFDAPITIASNATIQIEGTAATIKTLTGDINGPGEVLTKTGGGQMLLDQPSYTYSNKIVIAAGTMKVTGVLLNVTNITVQSGATLIGLAANFPSVLDGSITNVIVLPGGTWLQLHNATWIGEDANNGPGKWSDSSNWLPAIVPTNEATIPTPSSTRYITNDGATTLGNLTMGSDTDNRLWLEANMTVTGEAGGRLAYLYPNGNTFSFSESDGAYIPRLSGSGTIIKTGPNQTTMENVSGGSFTGTLIVRDGWCAFVNQNFGSSQWVAEDGGTLYVLEGMTLPTSITISGEGDNTSLGALYIFKQNYTLGGNLTVASNATVGLNSSFVTSFTLTGDLIGLGVLTLIGGPTFDMNNTWNYAISGAAGNKIIADSGTVNISNATLSVSGEETATEKEYVVIDYSGAGTLAGEFAAINDLKPGGSIDYDGTDLNPDCVVLLAPSTGLILLIQ